MISGRRMEAAAAAEIRLGNQTRQFATELPPEVIQFGSILGEVDHGRLVPGVDDLVHREADELHARIAFGILFGTGHGVREALLPVKAVPRGDDHVARLIPRETRPQRLLDCLGPRRRPDDRVESLAPLGPLDVGEQPLHGQRFDLGDAVVGGHRDRRDVCRMGTLARRFFVRRKRTGRSAHPTRGLIVRVAEQHLCGPAHRLREVLHPPFRVVPEIRYQHTGRIVEQLPSLGSPVIRTGRLGKHRLRRSKRPQRNRLTLGHNLTDGIRLRFTGELDGRFHQCSILSVSDVCSASATIEYVASEPIATGSGLEAVSKLDSLGKLARAFRRKSRMKPASTVQR